MTIEHIGIAVKDLDSAVKTYEKLLDSPCYKREFVESEQVTTAFFRPELSAGENSAKIELLSAASGSSAIAGFIEKRGEGLHHIAFEVQDILAELARLKKEGFTLLNDEPKAGADNKLVAFVHPADNHGVLVELCQTR